MRFKGDTFERQEEHRFRTVFQPTTALVFQAVLMRGWAAQPAFASITSRTFRVKVSTANGFWRKTMPSSMTP
jgi:hypothetical protein